MRRRYLPVAMAGALMLLATACGGAPETPGGDGDGDLTGTEITFNVSLAEEEQAGIQAVLDAFTAETGATVKLSAVTADQMPQKLKVEVDSGENTIQLISQDNYILEPLVADELVQDVGDVEIPGEVSEALIPAQFDGTTYFLPFRPNVRVAYVNTERFNAAGVSPPTTVDEWRSVAETFAQEAGEPKVTVSFAEGSSTGVVAPEWILSFGGDPLILNDEGSVAAFEFLQDAWNDGLIAPQSLQAQFDTEVDYLRGETAWYAQNWPFTSGIFQQEGLLELFDVHQGWAGPAGEFHTVGGDVLAIPSGVEGKEREAAVALAEFLMSAEAQSILAAENAWPSIRTDATEDVPPELQETFDAVQAALENGWYRPSLPYWPDAEAAMNEAVRRILQEGEDVQSVLDELHGEIEQAAQKTGSEYPPASE